MVCHKVRVCGSAHIVQECGFAHKVQVCGSAHIVQECGFAHKVQVCCLPYMVLPIKCEYVVLPIKCEYVVLPISGSMWFRESAAWWVTVAYKGGDFTAM